MDENCLYTINDVKKALVDGHFVALAKNTNDEAFHNTANTEEYYISFAGCTWHPATKYAGEEKAYIVEGGIYIWYNNDWLLVEREDPFFFDYNEQNVKRYYEYENGEWVLADPKVRVTDAIETRDFFFLPEAFAIANGKKNATITILKDITDTTTPLSYTQTNTTCTLDLNGHTVNLTITGSGTTGVNMIKIDASGSTFTITDNSAEKDGKLILKQGITTATATKRWYGIVLANGSLALNAGEVQAINDFTYTSTSNTGIVSAVYVAAGKTFTMNGGSIYAESPYYPRAIDIAGATSAKATVTLNAGTITANATTVTNAMGIYTVGGTTTIKEGVTINTTTKTTSAYGIYVDASTSGYWGTVNMTGGTVNSTATTTTALGAFVNGTYTFNNTTPNTIKGTYRGVLNITGGTFNVITNGTTTAYGIQSRGTTTITGGTFNVTPKTTTAYGLLVQDGTTTISGTPTFTIKGTTTAYGIYANAATPDDKTGRPYNPNVIVNGGTFDVTTTTADIAYGIYAGAGTRVITSTASGYYPGTYSSIGIVTVNGGTFNVTAKTYNAIGVYVHRVAAYESGTNTAHVFRGVANIAGGTFTVRDLTHKTTTGACDGVRSYGTLTITGGTFDVAASAATVKNATYAYGVNVYDGTATISGNPEFTVSAYGTTYGAVANGATPDKATGLPCEADLTIDGGTFNVNTTTSTTAYGVYAAGPAPRVITSTAAGYYPGTYYSKPVATVNDGTFNVKAKTTTAIGAYCGRGVLYDQEVLEPHTVELESFGELNIKGGTFNVSTLGTTTADGVRSFGTTNITGGTFNVTPKTTTAMGVRAYAGKTTITGNPHFTVKGTTTVYGLNAGCEAPNSKSGLTYNGEIECNGGTFDLETTTGATCYGVYAFAGSVKITTLHSADANYFAGNYASAGTIVVNDGIFNVKAKTTGAYGVVVPAAVSQSGATGYPTATATAKCDINGGKFLVNGTEKYAVYKKATTANFKISGGYWGGDGVNNNLAYYAVSPNKVLTLRSSHAVYADGYRFAVGEGGTVTWKNGTTTLLAEVYESGETPEYTGATPTKTADAQYTYTFSGWSPAIAAMENSDVTYTATFSRTPRTYTVTLNTNGGTINAGDVTEYTYGTGATLPTDVTNEGHEFVGWFDNEELTGDAVTSISTTATGNKKYWAKWALKKCTITWRNWDGSPLKEPTITSTINYGSAPGYSLVGNPAPTREASDGKTYEWDGWTTVAYGAGMFYGIDNLPDATGDATYYAHFRITAIDVASTKDISINEDAEVTTTTVRVEGKLNVPQNVTLTTDDLILEGTPSSSGEITGEVTAKKRALFDFSQPGGFKARTWYAVAVPWQVDVKAYAENNGVYIINGNAEPVRQMMGTDFDLIYYDGALRAAEGHSDNCWKYVEDDDQEKHIMYPGRAYMIYLTSDAQTIRFERKSGTKLITNTLAVYKYTAKDSKNASWNGIANPATYHAYINANVKNYSTNVLDVGQVYNAETRTYSVVNMDKNNLVVGQPIFVQAIETNTSVVAYAAHDDAFHAAPRRAKVQDASLTHYELMIAPNEEEVADRIFVGIDEDKETNEYIIGQDLVKMGVSNIVPQMWVDRYESKMCINTVAPVNNRADYPLGISVQQSGAYDLFIDDQPDDETMLYLTYDGEAIWNLSYGGYVVNLEKGTNSHYGLRIVRSPKVTTDIEEATILNGEAVRKVIVEDKVFIIRNDQIYGIDGRLVK